MPTQTQTTTTIPIAPTYTPEQLAMQNVLYNQFYGNIGYTSPLYSQLMGGYGVPGYVNMPQVSIPEPYREQQELDAATRKYSNVEQAFRNWDDAINYQGSAFEKSRKITLAASELGKTLGISGIENVKDEYSKWASNPEEYKTTYLQPYQEKLDYAQEAINKQYAPLIERQQAIQPTQQPTMQPIEQPMIQPERPIQPTTQAEQIAQTYGTQMQQMPISPLQAIQAQSPEQIAEKYKIMEQQGQRGIEDWWNQSQRALEQRGIVQRGGYEGSGMTQDLGSLLAQRGRMQQDLGTQLGLSQMQAQQQLPYQQLAALEPIRQFEARYQQQQQFPWLGYGQSMLASVPWGSTQQTSAYIPSPGIIPTALGTLGTVGGLYGMGRNFGWWGGGNTGGYGSWNPNAYDRY